MLWKTRFCVAWIGIVPMEGWKMWTEESYIFETANLDDA